MTSIDSSLYLNNQQKVRTPSQELGKEEFLKLLMVQLQNQDPTSPMDDSQFMSQMATFSSLEQMMNMSNSIEMLVNNSLVSPVLQYSHMIGEEVSYMTFDEETGKETGVETSKVVGVTQNQGWAVFELENGERIYADAVVQVGKSNIDDGEQGDADPDNEEESE
ncbi:MULTISPECIES: flagellar hook assembly protein FlgD [Oceanobacillus]|uniref:Flagellar hook assembly protein FlgD n=1 Tax=Oceanobacillus kimchii TaxID=746691 RepID=A0ABQ5TK00_9BACI|nr:MULTISPECIES: flagellar hook assembly protein FlgD [Oceanobacillus]MBT2598705.1 flagellar hook assembly protein FlgD [Oceanobacillus sp. ISL-74]MBT2651624.1 flagellar hook assembly protein FlgD [Oceanobacillus sp. ISL-73]MCT1576273.1 flagellar hook assembly protein FlgD [Oceanobacillus kimchii]MCT2135910.1 flagellar hook assembly protein FlgD [Oceanobacillus kimchii]OEH54666.1 flagellar biosynthesis protein FlgD [Oceanobacillus sp. E9]